MLERFGAGAELGDHRLGLLGQRLGELLGIAGQRRTELVRLGRNRGAELLGVGGEGRGGAGLRRHDVDTVDLWPSRGLVTDRPRVGRIERALGVRNQLEVELTR